MNANYPAELSLTLLFSIRSQGDIFLKFDSVQSATNAVQTLGGRFFAGRQIVAAFLPELLYNARFPSAANL